MTDRPGRYSQDFKNLQVWQRSFRLAIATYRVTASFPKEERYGLTSQMRRCVVSIPANVAEGCGRGGAVELARYVEIARGSASELETYLMMASELKIMEGALCQRLLSELGEVQRMLSSFRARVLREEDSEYA